MPKGIYPRTKKHRAKLSAALQGIVRSIETKAKMSVAKIGNQNGLGHRHTDEARAKIGDAKIGKNHWNWQGGISFDYGPDWEQQKQLALERDKHTCQNCTVTKEELNQEPDVHHKIPYRDTQDNNLENLVCLCRSCHSRTERRFREVS